MPAEVATDDAILQRFTGQTDVRDPRVAAVRLDAATTRLAEASWEFRRARMAHYGSAMRMLPVHLRAEPWVLALATGAAAAFAVSMTLYFAFGVGQGVVAALTPALFLLVGVAVFLTFRDRAGEVPETRAAIRRSRLARARSRVGNQRTAVAGLRRDVDQANALLRGIRQAIAYPVARLLAARCDDMTGTEFELYLAEIFALLGYAVERLGGSGDQGVDLILTRDGVRIAVQAKCYGSPLGNSPIQEVYTGSVLHRCERWAVVTNNTFTAGGRAAAAATRTTLIEGSQLPALIRGQIPL